jgi:HEAT repeat protein
MAEEILQNLISTRKLDRDKGLDALKKLIRDANNSDEEFSLYEHAFSVVLNETTESEKLQGCLTASRELSQHLSLEYCNQIVKMLPKLLDSKEPRVRQVTGEVLGQICRWKGVEYYEMSKEIILGGIRHNLERDEDLLEGSTEAESLKEKLVNEEESERGKVTAAMIFHDTAGWKGLETYMYALQQTVEGCRAQFEPHITKDLLHLLYMALSHANRFVREMGFKALAVISSCIPVASSSESVPQVVRDHWQSIANHIAKGLADNWSQVRMASSVAARNFLTNIKCAEVREAYLPALVPAMCLNRYYVAEGVRLYSQETWRLVMQDKGIQYVEKHIDSVVAYYISQSGADNHAVREAACICIAELGKKIDSSLLRGFVRDLMPTLIGCFKDDSWPVRDAACLACGNFVSCFPEESKPFLKELLDLFFHNLEDSIPSVRQGGAVALAIVVEAYEPAILEKVAEEVKQRLQLVKDQPADSEMKNPGIDPGPATFGVVKKARDNNLDLHTDQTMYSCGSLAPRMRKSGGCMDHGFQKPSQPWEKSEGCIHLVGELSRNKMAASYMSELLPLAAQAASYKHYVHHVSLVESLMKQLPVIARNLGKKQFKNYLADFFGPIFYGLKSSNALLHSAAVDCTQQLSSLLGRMIFRGRVELYNPAHLPLLDRICP